MFQRLTSAVAGLLIVASGMFAQSPAPRPKSDEFEVATIKPTPPDPGGRWIRMQSTHQFAAKNHALKTLLAAAYNLSLQAISGGPAWVDSDRYDIVAKAPGEARPNLDEQMAMLRKLLAERFKLILHREQRITGLRAEDCEERPEAAGEHVVAGCLSGGTTASHFCGVAPGCPAARPQRDHGRVGLRAAASRT